MRFRDYVNEGDDLSSLTPRVLKRIFYKKIMKADKKGLDKLFKQFEKRQEQARKRQRFGFSNDELDLLKSWFDERMKQLGLQESYSFDDLNEEQMYRVEIKGITHDWMSLDDAKFDPKGKRYTKKEAEAKIKKAVKAGRGKKFIRMVKESLNEAPIGAKGWTQESIAKFEKTIGKKADEHGFFDACVMRMEGKEGFDNEKARGFCASIKDAAYGSPNWRGKGKSKEQVKKDVKKDKFKKQLPEK